MSAVKTCPAYVFMLLETNKYIYRISDLKARHRYDPDLMKMKLGKDYVSDVSGESHNSKVQVCVREAIPTGMSLVLQNIHFIMHMYIYNALDRHSKFLIINLRQVCILKKSKVSTSLFSIGINITYYKSCHRFRNSKMMHGKYIQMLIHLLDKVVLRILGPCLLL